MFNIKLILLILVIFIIINYYLSNVEHFNFPQYYPISYQNNIDVSNIEKGGSIINYDLSHLIRLIKQTKIIINGDNTNISFNKAFLPITTINMDPTKLKPIVNYIINIINKLGDNIHSVQVIGIQEVCKEDTDAEMKISFEIKCSYYRTINDTYYTNKYLVNNEEKIKENVYKIQDVILKCVIIVQKSLIDTLQENEDISNIFVDKLYIMGLMDDQYLPGSNVTELDLFWQYNKPMSNRIVDERIIRDLKDKHQNELNRLTQELPTHD